jgi:hypothetical protein
VYGGVWQNKPLSLVYHFDEFFVEVVNVIVGGSMRAPGQGACDLVVRPWRCRELYRCAAVLVESQETAGRVMNTQRASDGMPLVS